MSSRGHDNIYVTFAHKIIVNIILCINTRLLFANYSSQGTDENSVIRFLCMKRSHVKMCFIWILIFFQYWLGTSDILISTLTQQEGGECSLSLKAGVGYIRQNKPVFHHFLPCSHAVNIYRGLSLTWLASYKCLDYSWQVLSAQWPCCISA